MARSVLNDKAIARMGAAPEGTRANHWDVVVHSLALRITDKGRKSWVVQRRVNGRMMRIKLGDYPILSLAKAREKAREVIESMAIGRDPRQTRAITTATALRRDSFEGAIDTYIAREVLKNRRPRTQDEIIRPLKRLCVPRWSTLPLSEIGPREILDVLDQLVDDDKPVAANRTYSVLHRFFQWAVERQLIDANPAARVRKPSIETARSRVLTDQELRLAWMCAGQLGWPWNQLYRTLMISGQRRNEVSGMLWSELDRKERIWKIPAARTKNGIQHIVPLVDEFDAILDSIPRSESDLVFTTNGNTPVSGFSKAKRRLDQLMFDTTKQLALDESEERLRELEPFRVHDFRRTCATGMARLGVQPHIIEVVLNHAGGFRSGVAGVYQRYPYFNERREALTLWGHHITTFTNGRGDNVVPLRALG